MRIFEIIIIFQINYFTNWIIFEFFHLVPFNCLASTVYSVNPILGLLDPNCFVTRSGCPNENVTFWLYTNTTRDSPLQLDPLNLNPDDFVPARSVKILIHGYTGHRDFSPNIPVRPELLQHEDVYVISPDFGPLVRLPCYFAGVENLPVASKCLAQLINNLVSQKIVDNDDIHIIGFSLGAQVAGQTANYVDKKLKRITGLDPAKPMFITVGPERKLDPSDADFVDVIHTDVLGRGMLRAMGHVDFYPNMGPYQPGCQSHENPGSCNHNRAPEYYAESISSSNGFWSYGCSSWLHHMFGLCFGKGNDAVMGYHVNQSANGSYFLQTNNHSPFAMGAVAVAQSNNEIENNLKYYNLDQINDEGFEPQLLEAFTITSDDEAFETLNLEYLEAIKEKF